MRDEQEKEFCKELTDLLWKYHLGITDEPHIYFLESDDYGRNVSIDSDGCLHFD